MPRYRKIDPRIWNDGKFRDLDDRGKLLFLFVLTHPHMTSLGAMRASIPGLAAEIGWSEKAFREAFRQASLKGLLEHDEKASFLAAPNFIKYNRPESPNVVTSWKESLDLIPECGLKAGLIQRVKAFTEGLSKGFQEALPEVFGEAFAKSMPNQEQEQEQESPLTPHRGNGQHSGLDPEQIRARWNDIPGIKACRALGSTIRTRIRSRLEQHPDPAWWDDLFHQVRASDFLCGRVNGVKDPFQATLDWVLSPKNLDKVLAGNYENSTPPRQKERLPL